MKYTADNVPFSEVEKYLSDHGYDVKDLDPDLMQEAKEETAMTLNGESFLGGSFEFPPLLKLDISGSRDAEK